MVEPGTRAPVVAAAWEALGRGDWAEAAAGFDRALGQDPDDAWALEGRAWTAWWLDDAETLFRAREHAVRAHRDRGDPASAARAAIWLGCDHHEIRGEHAVANGWYQRARRLLEGLPTTPEHGWLAFHEGAYAVELDDDTATGRERAAEVLAIGRELGVSDLVFLGLALEGLALVTEGAVAEGMRRLDEASVAATSGELQERVAITWTLCYLIYACERVRDFDRTSQWCRRMQEFATRFGFEAGVGICRVHYGGVLVLHGDWAGAERELERSRTIFAGVRPEAVRESDARLGELRRRQGRLDEAEELLLRARPHPLASLGLASLALDRDDPGTAVALLDELVEATPAGSVTQLADALALLAVAHAELGRPDGATAAAVRLEEIAAMVGNRPLAAMAAAARGAALVAADDAGRARPFLERAADLFERSGLPFEAAAVRGDLAVALAALGRDDEAATQAEEAVRRFRELGADGAAARARRRLASAVSAPAPGVTVPGLTPREREVLALVSVGLRDREIAERLSISPHTVHRHVSNILTKLAVPSRTAAVAHAARLGTGA